MNNETIKLLLIFGVSGLFLLNILSYYSSKIKLLPDIIWILLLGVGYSSILAYSKDELPQLSLQPDLVLYIFVPLLVFASTQKMCLSHFKKVLLPASIIASLGILISMVVIAVPLSYFFNINILYSLLFGAIISATDPLAVGALLSSNNKIPEEQKLLIEGESILNDGFVVTIFGILSVIIFSNERFVLTDGILELISHILGALVVGVILGRFGRYLLYKWHEKHFILTVNMTLAIAYSSFFIGEYFEFSGILSVFSAALAYGYKPDKTDHDTDIHEHVWEYFEYLANSILFFMLGASLFTYFSWQTINIIMVAVSLCVLFISRPISLAMLHPFIFVQRKKLNLKEFNLLNFAGARGAVSIALILLLPESFQLKQVFLSLAFIMVFTSLILYPLIIKRILK